MRILLFLIYYMIVSSPLAFANNFNKWTIEVQDQVLYMLNDVHTFGSGFVIEQNNNRQLVVSNVHVVAALMDGHDKLPDNITLIALDLQYDLVVLEIEKHFPEEQILTLADTDIDTDTSVTMIGFINRKRSTVTGTLLPYNYSPHPVGFMMLMTDHNDLKGASGSPILNSEGQVISILTVFKNNFIHFSSVVALRNLLSKDPLICQWQECLNNELNRLHQLAETDPYAQYILAILYLHGLRGEKNNKMIALNLLLASANLEYPPAQFEAGLLLWKSEGADQDTIQYSTSLIELAAHQGFVLAQYKLSQRLYYGTGIELNKTKAREWMRKAADQKYFLATQLYRVKKIILTDNNYKLSLNKRM